MSDKTQDQIDLTELARALDRYYYAVKKGDLINKDEACTVISNLFDLLPSGSGIDNGMTFEWTKSKPNKLVFKFSWHHMDEHGGYDGWTDHTLTITPCFVFGFVMKITGRDKNQIKAYLYELFGQVFWH